MRMSLTKCVLIVALISSMGMTAATRIGASPPPWDHYHRHYSENKNYMRGMRDGREDSAHHRDHSKKKNFKNDNDRQNYEAGYRHGHRGDLH